jgi:site-specific DNA-cytosine methylase
MKLNPLRPCPAILKKDGDISARGKMHWSEKRRPTTNEFMRWGSFPDAFRFIGGPSKAVERIGNSVPPLLMRSIAAHVRGLVAP